MPKRVHDEKCMESVPSLFELCFQRFQQTLHPAVREHEPKLNLLEQLQRQLEFQEQRTKKPNTTGRTAFIRQPVALAPLDLPLDLSGEELDAWKTNRLLGTTVFTIKDGSVSWRMNSWVHPEAWFSYETNIFHLLEWCNQNEQIMIVGRLGSEPSQLWMTVHRDHMRIDDARNFASWAEVAWPETILQQLGEELGG